MLLLTIKNTIIAIIIVITLVKKNNELDDVTSLSIANNLLIINE